MKMKKKKMKREWESIYSMFDFSTIDSDYRKNQLERTDNLLGNEGSSSRVRKP